MFWKFGGSENICIKISRRLILFICRFLIRWLLWNNLGSCGVQQMQVQEQTHLLCMLLPVLIWNYWACANLAQSTNPFSEPNLCGCPQILLDNDYLIENVLLTQCYDCCMFLKYIRGTWVHDFKTPLYKALLHFLVQSIVTCVSVWLLAYLKTPMSTLHKVLYSALWYGPPVMTVAREFL